MTFLYRILTIILLVLSTSCSDKLKSKTNTILVGLLVQPNEISESNTAMDSNNLDTSSNQGVVGIPETVEVPAKAQTIAKERMIALENSCKPQEGFSYETSRSVLLKIKDNGTNVKYDVYSFHPGENIAQLGTGSPVKGVFQLVVNTPTHIKTFYIVRRSQSGFYSQKLDIDNDCAFYQIEADIQKTTTQTRDYTHDFSNENDVLYGVNGSGDLFVIDTVNFKSTIIAQLPETGSFTNAIDVTNRQMYFLQGGDLWRYDMTSSTYTKIGNLGRGGGLPRMEYSTADGLLYMGNHDELYLVDPLRAEVLSTYKIDGIVNSTTGGDLKFAADGTLYMCTFSGLYRLGAITEGTSIQAERLSADGLPFTPTSMTIDSAGILYLGENSGQAKLIVMDPTNGNWELKHTYKHKINDLSTLPRDEASLSQEDTDNDGIPNYQDQFPEDSNKAFTSYTPSRFGYGSLAFEDLWPRKGDYDFNDLVVNYRFSKISNSQGQYVELLGKFKITAIGAAYNNGFAFSLPISPEKVASVTGSNLSKSNFIQLADNGTEKKQSRAVIVVFDEARRNIERQISGTPAVDGIVLEIKITFTEPISPTELGQAPFDPFIFVNGQRGREVHLMGHEPTDLFDSYLAGTADDRSLAGTSFSNDKLHPWALHIIHDFHFPLERVKIEDAYMNFGTWAESRGREQSDWYTDKTGNRNTKKMYIRSQEWQ
ncbi:MAG: LruC domain-containing protein [Spirochaetota bacterium]